MESFECTNSARQLWGIMTNGCSYNPLFFKYNRSRSYSIMKLEGGEAAAVALSMLGIALISAPLGTCRRILELILSVRQGYLNFSTRVVGAFACQATSRPVYPAATFRLRLGLG